MSLPPELVSLAQMKCKDCRPSTPFAFAIVGAAKCCVCRQKLKSVWHDAAVLVLPWLPHATCERCFLRFQRDGRRATIYMFVDRPPWELTEKAIGARFYAYDAVRRTVEYKYWVASEWLRCAETGCRLHVLLGDALCQPTTQELYCLSKREWENRVFGWRRVLKFIHCWGL